MRCTDCNTRIRPVVSVDIDGTLGNYHDHFLEFAEMYVGYPIPWTYSGREEFSDFLKMDKELYREVKLAYRQGGMKRSMPMYHDAMHFMNQLHVDGYEVWIATTRPWMRLDNIDPDTRHWLERNRIPWDYMIYGEDKYDQLLDRVDPHRIIAIIDDQLDECMRANAAMVQRGGPSGLVWQPRRSHNTGQPYSQTFDTFDRMLAKITAKRNEWEAVYA